MLDRREKRKESTDQSVLLVEAPFFPGCMGWTVFPLSVLTSLVYTCIEYRAVKFRAPAVIPWEANTILLIYLSAFPEDAEHLALSLLCASVDCEDSEGSLMLNLGVWSVTSTQHNSLQERKKESSVCLAPAHSLPPITSTHHRSQSSVNLLNC